MTTTSTADVATRSRPMSAEERKVIIASSAGTIFEWYDFYLYGSLAAVIGAQFFSAYPEATRNVFALLAFAAGFLVSVRRARVRPPRRPHRPQGNLPHHHPDHGPVDVPRRLPAELRDDRRHRAHHAHRAAHGAGPRARRRVRRRCHLRGRARAAGRRGYFTSFIQTTATLGLSCRSSSSCSRRST